MVRKQQQQQQQRQVSQGTAPKPAAAKRKRVSFNPVEDSLPPADQEQLGQLDLESDNDAAQDVRLDDDQDPALHEFSESDDEGGDNLDDFPVLDDADSDEGDGLVAAAGLNDKAETGDEEDRDSDEDEEESEDLEDDEDDLEGEFDSEDIDNWDSDAEDAKADDLAAQPLTEQGLADELSKMVARASRKPNEAMAQTNKLGLPFSVAAPSILPPGRNPDGSAAARWEVSAITNHPKRVYPAIEADYDSDSSTEDAPNRIGNVPLEWYDDLPHIGYTVDGKKVMRPAKGDALDRFLQTVEDPDAWTSAEDRLMGKDTKLTDEELDIIRRLQNAEIPDADFNQYEPSTDWFTGEGKQMIMPLDGRPEPKRRFVPSKWEHKKVMKIVRAIRQGRITPRAPSSDRPKFFNIWSDADVSRADHPMHMPAPKRPPPGHAESYNPPAEFLFDEEERKAWEESDPSDRKVNFLPSKHSALRLVPGYKDFVQERFERCLDLYLAPRTRKTRIDIEDPDTLLPKLPSPRELRPFPTTLAITFPHPAGVRVRCIAPDPTGSWLATGADDGKVRLWDTAIGRCTTVWDLQVGSAKDDRGPVHGLEWCPNKSFALLAAATSGKLTVIAPAVCNGVWPATASGSFQHAIVGYQAPGSEGAEKAASAAAAAAKWVRPSEAERKQGIATHIALSGGGVPKQVCWHPKGDYFASVTPGATGTSRSVVIHQLSRHRSQAPFRRASSGSGSAVQRVVFHPTRPHLFVATQRQVRVYDLAAQSLLRTLQPGVKWISSLDVHPGGENLIVGSYDRRLIWFDLELSTRPYKTLRYHARALRAVAFHKGFPLVASVSDDGTAHVLHATVYSDDLARSPLIVPLKVLKGHQIKDGLGVLDTKWHPNMPWLFTAGADGEARLWTT